MTRMITAKEATRLIAQGAVLIDIREADEHRRERIAGALNCPLSSLGQAPLTSEAVIFHCASGARTQSCVSRLAEFADGRYWSVLEGGLAGWKKAGLPITKSDRAPIELQRQVMIVAGSLVLLGALLATLVWPIFIAIPIFVGGGLLFAGLSGFCGMARILMKAPWNRAEPHGG